MDLFEYQTNRILEKKAPLPNRIHLSTLDEFVGQSHILKENSALYNAIKEDKLSSLILYGPSGSGKTTLSKIIAKNTKAIFKTVNATNSNSKELKETIEKAKINLTMYGKKTIFFIDEIHRLNKAQQDILLPYVENGTVILIGATTENPFFEINKALLSRSFLFEFLPLSDKNIKSIIQNTIKNNEKFFDNLDISITNDALDYIAKISSGDARIALNMLEFAVLSVKKNEDNKIIITKKILTECASSKIPNYNNTDDNHYNSISALIKSMRGSDPDASVYYLAKMLYSGEDPLYIARRIIICASEDVGNADPRALQIAVSAFEATKIIGMPECRIVLSQAVCYIASAPKSNASYIAINKAFDDVQNISINAIPKHLTQTFEQNMYKYPHNYDKNYVNQQYLPNELISANYYLPSSNGYEKNIKNFLEFIKKNN